MSISDQYCKRILTGDRPTGKPHRQSIPKFKEIIQTQHIENSNMGSLRYPVPQAADILLMRADLNMKQILVSFTKFSKIAFR